LLGAQPNIESSVTIFEINIELNVKKFGYEFGMLAGASAFV
jgi:hypothetical protein